MVSGNGLGIFSVQLTNLSSSTTYYIKAYAINARGIGYGDQIAFTTNSIIKDIENNTYGIVMIGTSWWFTENLKTKHYLNGDEILTTIPASKDITGEATPKYQWAYDSIESNVSTYGRLYTGYVVLDNRGVCPTGWHVPSDADWSTLITYLGGEKIAAGKLKEIGLSHWLSPNTAATNEFGFSAVPGGSRDYTGKFNSLGNYATWQTATSSSFNAYHIQWNSGELFIGGTTRNYGFSVRCIRDN